MRSRFIFTGRKPVYNTNTEPFDWICFSKYWYNSEILVIAIYLHKVIEFRMYILSSTIVNRKLPKLSSKQVRRLNQSSLQSRSNVELYWDWFGTRVERRLDQTLETRQSEWLTSRTKSSYTVYASLYLALMAKGMSLQERTSWQESILMDIPKGSSTCNFMTSQLIFGVNPGTRREQNMSIITNCLTLRKKNILLSTCKTINTHIQLNIVRFTLPLFLKSKMSQVKSDIIIRTDKYIIWRTNCPNKSDIKKRYNLALLVFCAK